MSPFGLYCDSKRPDLMLVIVLDAIDPLQATLTCPAYGRQWNMGGDRRSCLHDFGREDAIETP